METRPDTNDSAQITMDAFGSIVKRFYEGQNVSEVLERSDGYLAGGDLSRYFADYDAWDEVEKRLISRVSQRVLDIGCGVGRHALYLQTKGIEVLGVDSSPACIEIAAARGVRNASTLAIEQIDQAPDPPYDSVLLLGNNLGLLGSKTKARSILTALARVTSPAARIFGSTSDYLQTDDPAHQAYYDKNRRRNRLPGTARVRLRWHEVVGDWFDFVLFTEEDLVSVLEGTRWEIEERIVATDGVRNGYVIRKAGNAKH